MGFSCPFPCWGRSVDTEALSLPPACRLEHSLPSQPGITNHVPLIVILCLGFATAQKVGAEERPQLESPKVAEYCVRGPLGDRISANTRNWLMPAPGSNPAMLQMFRDRDRTPRRELVPWAGEFAGKYLISAVQALRLTGDKQLEAHLRRFVADLIATQDRDGYLGPFARDARMTGKGLWDLWGQYHVMLGLYRWYEATGDRTALAACRRCAEYFCDTFVDGGKRVIQAGSEEMNESCIHFFVLLYRQTGEPRYLGLAREIEKDWQTSPSGDYVRLALAGKPFHQMPKPRWESLPGIQAIAEFYWITGDDKYRKAFAHIWWSILEGDRHNSGGFSSGEQATGNPYDPRPVETCCTIAWMALTLDYLRLTGDSRAADELELSTWNAVLGAQNAEGRWWTYNTPMDGERKASAHDIVFQARAGSPELNCCSVNGPRGIGVLSEWAVMTAKDGVTLNYYGPCALTVPSPSGRMVRLVQETDYPISGRIRLRITPEREERFALRLRIPGWSQRTSVIVNDQEPEGARAGTYLVLNRKWKRGDTVTIGLDLSPRLWVGEREVAGKVALYHGPLLLAYDPRFDSHDIPNLPALDLKRLTRWQETERPRIPASGSTPLLLLRFPTENGHGITLCDFASAGAAGNRYVSWLPRSGLRPAPFSRDNPLRAVRP
jgi:uncharacterized protein